MKKKASSRSRVTAAELLPRLRLPDGLRLDWYGEQSVYRPSQRSIDRVRGVLADHARRLGLEGLHEQPEDVNNAVLKLYEINRQIFEVSLPKIRCRGLVEFLMEQHEGWNKIHRAREEMKIPLPLRNQYEKTGPTARLAIQWILECCVKDGISPAPTCPDAHYIFWTDAAVIAAEEMVKLSLHSTVVQHLGPNSVTIRVEPDNSAALYDLRFVAPFGTNYDAYMVRLHTPTPARYADLRSPGDLDGVMTALAPAFQAEFGLTLQECLGVLWMLDHTTRPPKSGFPVPFIRVDLARTGLQANLNINLQVVDEVLAAFVLTPEHFAIEDRELWRPRQDQRMQRRPLLRLPHDLGPHYCWKQNLLEKSTLFVVQEMCFGRLPREWRRARLTRAVEDLSRKLDADWENTVHAELTHRGLRGCLNVQKLEVGGRTLRVGALKGVGEIDGLYSDPASGAIIVVEVKRTQPSYGPAQFWTEMSAYAEGDNCYAAKLRRKAIWVHENWSAVCGFLVRQGAMATPPESRPDVRMVLITKYECFASTIVTSPPIFSLVRLLQAIDGGAPWPSVTAVVVPLEQTAPVSSGEGASST